MRLRFYMVSKKRLFLGLLFLGLTLVILFNWNLLCYGYGQLKGQLYVISNTQELEDVLNQETFPDSLKSKLKLIRDVKAFAEEELGLEQTNNYETVYDQKGQPILWIVTAAEKYSLTSYSWDFPFLGEVEYKGFFEYEKAENEQNRLIEQGFDTDIREVMAWSTLGWFRDPVLTNFLNKPDYQLVNLIIHELTHSTLYLPDSVTFNENFANFVAHQGTLLFFENKPQLLEDYKAYYHDDSLYTSIVLNTAKELDTFYTKKEGLPTGLEKEKTQLILNGISLLEKGLFIQKNRYRFNRLKSELPNNTYYLGFMRYESKQDYFYQLYKDNNRDMKLFMKHLIDVNSN